MQTSLTTEEMEITGVTTRLPKGLWRRVKAKANLDGKTAEQALAEAAAAYVGVELPPMTSEVTDDAT